MGAPASWSTRWTRWDWNILENTSLYPSPDVTADQNTVLCRDPKVFLFVPNCKRENPQDFSPWHRSAPKAAKSIEMNIHTWYPFFLRFLRLFRLLKSCCQTFSLQLNSSSSKIIMESLKTIDQSKKSDAWCTVSQILPYLFILLWQVVYLC